MSFRFCAFSKKRLNNFPFFQRLPQKFTSVQENRNDISQNLAKTSLQCVSLIVICFATTLLAINETVFLVCERDLIAMFSGC